ncbi:general substrate transporter [Coniochaeta sp. PMI_546]|nr:general substrate transporter [Coniochaeta sp. PMI_546]
MHLEITSGSFWFMVLCAGVAGVSGLMFGYDSGIITDTIAQELFLAYFENPSASLIGCVVAMLQAGAAVGAGIAAPMNDAWGRKKAMMVGAACGVIGAALQAGAVHTAMLIVGRLIIGLGVGILTMVVPIYQAEIAPPNARAFIMSIESIMTAFGYVIANWVGYGSSFSKTSFQWRFPLSMQVVFALIILLATPFLPASTILTDNYRIASLVD